MSVGTDPCKGLAGDKATGLMNACVPMLTASDNGAQAGAAGRWAGYQVLLLDKLEQWVNGQGGGERLWVIQGLLRFYHVFLRRAAALAAADVDSQQQQAARAAAAASSSSTTPQPQAAGSSGGGSSSKAATQLSSTLWAKPMFLLGMRLWGMLWTQPSGSSRDEAVARVGTARSVLQALAERDVYHYDSDSR